MAADWTKLDGSREKVVILVVEKQPALKLGSVRVQIIPALPVIDPARLLYIILIIIPFPVDQPPPVSRQLG